MADKISFVLYTRYEEQINMLNDEQAGQLMKAIFAYQKKGEAEVSDPVVAMLWSVIKQQLDIDNQKYQETCNNRKEAGKKGGRPKKTEGSGNAEEKAKKPNGFSGNQTKAKEPDNDIEYDCEIDRDSECDISSSSDDDDDIKNNRTGVCGDGASGSQQHSKLVKWLDIMTTTTDMEQFKALTSRLFQTYRPKRISLIDYEKTVNAVQVLGVTADGTHYAAYDQQKAALLEYAFQQAAAAENVTWKYIGGIYRNFEERGITTVEQAEAYEFERQHGQTPEHFLNHFYGE